MEDNRRDEIKDPNAIVDVDGNNGNNGVVVKEKTLRDYLMPIVDEEYSAIVPPPVKAKNFELKPSLIRLVQQYQFGGSSKEDPYGHLAMFLWICGTLKLDGVSDDAIRLRLFPFSLKDKAEKWLEYSLQPGSITTWEELTHKFLSRFFPLSKIAQFRREISCFEQHDSETLYEAWERFKELLRRCPQHGFAERLQVEFFYCGMNGQTRTFVDAAAGGGLMSKTPIEAHLLIEKMSANSYHWPCETRMTERVAGVSEAKTAALFDKINASLKVQESYSYINVEFDGASKGNPGPAGAGAVLRAEDGRVVCRLREGVGIATSNVAEYRALILGMKVALKEGFKHIRVNGDSKLVCMQVLGWWKIESQNLVELNEEAMELKDKFISFQINIINKDLNSEADALANQAIYLMNGEVQED